LSKLRQKSYEGVDADLNQFGNINFLTISLQLLPFFHLLSKIFPNSRAFTDIGAKSRYFSNWQVTFTKAVISDFQFSPQESIFVN
jgi:hypothetical protein